MTRRRVITRAVACAVVLNEIRGLAVVAMTWRLWWPLLQHAFHP